MIKLLELFAGIGAPRKALEKMGVEYKTIDAVEIDKKAMEAYNLIYGTKHQPRDIVKYHPNLGNEEIDILFQGSPCQDFSLIGKQLGGKKGSQTRSALVWEVIRVVDELKNKPKVIIWENVKSLKSKKHSPVLLEYIEDLKQRGYSSSYKILNAADFGIPQARERVFVVSVLNSAGIEFNFNNVKTKPLEKLTTFLEKEVEKSYYFEKEFFSKKNVDTNKF